MATMPEDVQIVKRRLSKDPSDELYNISQLLINETPELIAMWRALERRNVGDDDLWVWVFLGAAFRASNLPPYHYMSASDRRSLADDICFDAETLSRRLKVNGLDVHFIFSDKEPYNGVFPLEDFEAPTQARFIRDAVKKVKISKMIEGIAKRSRKLIEEEPLPGKVGKQVKAIRFVRLMAERNIRQYNKPLNDVIATSTNVLFDTEYQKSDIRKLLSR